MLIVAEVIGTKDYINHKPFSTKIKPNEDFYWFKDRQQINTVAFYDDSVYLNFKYALQHESVYYIRQGRKQLIDAILMDTDTLTFKIFSMHELAERIQNGVRIEGICLYKTFFSIQSCWKQLENFTAVKVESDFKLFLLKKLMLEKPCYIVRLLSVNDKSIDFKLEDYKYDE